MSDRVNMLMVREILGGEYIFTPNCEEGKSKSYLLECLQDPVKLNYAFIWERTKQGDRYWRECYEGTIFRSEIERRLSILLPLIYEKPLTLEDLI